MIEEKSRTQTRTVEWFEISSAIPLEDFSPTFHTVNHKCCILIQHIFDAFADMSEDDQWPALLDSITEKLRVNNVPHQVSPDSVDLILSQAPAGGQREDFGEEGCEGS